MDGTHRLQRFKGITSLGYFVLILLKSAYNMIMPVLARRNAEGRDSGRGAPRQSPQEAPVVTTDVKPVMVPGAGMLGLITIEGNGSGHNMCGMETLWSPCCQLRYACYGLIPGEM